MSNSTTTDSESTPERRELPLETINYDAQRMIGHGSFGTVFLVKILETEEVVAIKKVLQDKRFKNRELQIMKQLARQPHPNVVLMRNHFVSKSSRSDDLYLNLVLEFVPETLYSVMKQHNRNKEPIPILSTKLYMYQLARALAHIHGIGFSHRDIKPQNLLVDPARQILKLCDFGSAKALVPGEPNVAYICSRFYRAPELIFGATEYTTAIDVWSLGCVQAELMLGAPIFPGSSAIDQLVEIVKTLGTPTREEITSMNSSYQEFKFPRIRPCPWESIFKPSTPPEAIHALSQMLVYVPENRLTAIQVCAHPFFDELRNPNTRLPDGSPLPPLFGFTPEERLFATPELLSILDPHNLTAGAGEEGTTGTGSEVVSNPGGGGGGGGAPQPYNEEEKTIPSNPEPGPVVGEGLRVVSLKDVGLSDEKIQDVSDQPSEPNHLSNQTPSDPSDSHEK